MSIPEIEASEVGATGLLWLFLSYGYVLYFASNLISEGSDLLLLVPSMAGLVGGVVLPLLGAVPDGAIMLFSGLGDISVAQETLSVGVGALAGSTIMLLTIPWALSVWGGRVDLGPDSIPNYRHSPKLTTPKATWKEELTETGVSLTDAVSHGGIVMLLTTFPYFLIQIPAFFLHGPTEEVAAGEKNWALAGFFVCIVGFFGYMAMQFRISQSGTDRGKRIAVVKKLLMKGKVSLRGALTGNIHTTSESPVDATTIYQATNHEGADYDGLYPDDDTMAYLKEILREAFLRYDENHDGTLDQKEVQTFFRDFHEDIGNDEMDKLFSEFDSDSNGSISFDEFIGACYQFIARHNGVAIAEDDDDVPTSSDRQEQQAQEQGEPSSATVNGNSFSSSTQDIMPAQEIADQMFRDEDEEAEEVPDDFTDLSPEAQQRAIMIRAFTMLSIGTALVLLFSDPMVEVMQEIAIRTKLPPFYVSFILAPLASNASEVLASMYYAKKKTRKTITVSLTALEGAASMNNTFCLSIFMGLIYFRGLAWQYTAETIAIILVQFLIGFVVQKRVMTSLEGLLILLVFPLSIALVATLEAFGFD